MVSRYQKIKAELKENPRNWLITGVAGFIGSNLLEALLKLNQNVVGLDNFATGHKHNLDEVKSSVQEEQWKRFRFIEGDICNLDTCRQAVENVNYVLHQAALGSVPRSINDPVATNSTNIDGFLNILLSAKEQGVESFTYAASSSTYGDHPALPKVEENIGNPLSPYAVTKYVNELYASVFSRTYDFHSIGLRYFNVFGPRQDPNGAYAAVIPKWTAAIINNEAVCINGDGETSRDFCFVDNVVQANILSAVKEDLRNSEVINVACGDRTSLNELFEMIRNALGRQSINYEKKPDYRDFRAGDVRHSQADISKANALVGYELLYRVRDGIEMAMPWYVKNLK